MLRTSKYPPPAKNDVADADGASEASASVGNGKVAAAGCWLVYAVAGGLRLWRASR